MRETTRSETRKPRRTAVSTFMSRIWMLTKGTDINLGQWSALYLQRNALCTWNRVWTVQVQCCTGLFGKKEDTIRLHRGVLREQQLQIRSVFLGAVEREIECVSCAKGESRRRRCSKVPRMMSFETVSPYDGFCMATCSSQYQVFEKTWIWLIALVGGTYIWILWTEMMAI